MTLDTELWVSVFRFWFFFPSVLSIFCSTLACTTFEEKLNVIFIFASRDKVIFLIWLLSGFSFIFVSILFENVSRYSFVCSYHLSCLVFSELPRSVLWCPSLFGGNSVITFQIFLLEFSLYIWLNFCSCFTVLGYSGILFRLSFFFSFCPFMFIFSGFYWDSLNLRNSFLCHVQCPSEPNKGILHFSQWYNLSFGMPCNFLLMDLVRGAAINRPLAKWWGGARGKHSIVLCLDLSLFVSLCSLKGLKT